MVLMVSVTPCSELKSGLEATGFPALVVDDDTDWVCVVAGDEAEAIVEPPIETASVVLVTVPTGGEDPVVPDGEDPVVPGGPVVDVDEVVVTFEEGVVTFEPPVESVDGTRSR